MWLLCLEMPLGRQAVSESRTLPRWTSWREPWTGLRGRSQARLSTGKELWLLLLPLRQVLTPGRSVELCKLHMSARLSASSSMEHNSDAKLRYCSRLSIQSMPECPL